MSHQSRPVRAKQLDMEWFIAALVSGLALTGRYCPPPFSVGVAYSYICICPFRAIYSHRRYDFLHVKLLSLNLIFLHIAKKVYLCTCF